MRPAGGAPLGAWRAYALVFAASASTLVLEIVGGRALAPAVGVSLYTWTTIIGVVLSGVALGSWLGGALARRVASAPVLATLMVGAAASVALVPVAAGSLDTATLAGAGPLVRAVALFGAFFLLPSALLGAITPLVAQLVVGDPQQAGAVVGRLGAVAAAGSIAGTFLAGFVLVPAFGTRAILFGVAACLVGLAALTGAAGRARRSGGAMTAGRGDR